MSPATPITLAIVHAQEGMRFGFKTWLEQAGAVKVVLEQDCPKELLKSLPPEGVQVVLLQVGGIALQLALETVEAVRRRFRGTAVLLIGEWTETMLARAVDVEPHGLLYGAVPLLELEQAVRVAAQGGLHPNALMRALMRKPVRPAAKAATGISLTPTQEKVLRLMCRADEPTYREIGEIQDVAECTIITHRKKLFKLFGVNTRGKLKAKAQALGML